MAAPLDDLGNELRELRAENKRLRDVLEKVKPFIGAFGNEDDYQAILKVLGQQQ